MLPFFISDEMGFSDEELLLFAASGGKAVEDTATGNPLVFTTDLARPLKSLLIPFTPQQEGTGDPSPQNVRPLVPWDGLKVWNGGKNLLNPAKYVFNTITSRGLTFEVQSDGSIKVTGTTESSDFGPTFSARFQLPAGTYYGYRDDGDVYIAYRRATSESGGETTGLVSPFTLDGSEWVYCNIYVRNPGTFDTIIHPQIARENTQTTYEPYVPITETDISFPSPVYGGTLDVVSGVLTVEWIAHTFDGTEQFLLNGSFTGGVRFLSQQLSRLTTAKSACSDMLATLTGTFTTITKLGFKIGSPPYQIEFFVPTDSIVEGDATTDDFKHWLSENNVTIVAPLATPQEITLTPEQITALKGDNTIWSDADGSMTAVYFKKG